MGPFGCTTRSYCHAHPPCPKVHNSPSLAMGYIMETELDMLDTHICKVCPLNCDLTGSCDRPKRRRFPLHFCTCLGLGSVDNMLQLQRRGVSDRWLPPGSLSELRQPCVFKKLHSQSKAVQRNPGASPSSRFSNEGCAR